MFKRLIITALFLLTLTGAAYGQAPVTVTGTVYAPNGVLATSGYVQFTITPTSQSIQYFVQGIGIIAPQTARCGISGAGLIRNLALSGACLVWGNDVITPGNTTYTVQYAPANVVSNTIRQLLIRGTTSNLNAPVFAPVIAIVPQFQTITTFPIAVNLIPAVDSVFNVGNPQAYYAAGYFRNLFADNCIGCGFSTIGDLPPLFTTTVVGSNVTFNLSNAAANTVFGRCTGSLGAPSYCSITTAMLPFTFPLSVANGGTGSSTVPGTTGSMFYNNAGAYAATSGLLWDNTARRIGIINNTNNAFVAIAPGGIGFGSNLNHQTAPRISVQFGVFDIISAAGVDITLGPSGNDGIYHIDGTVIGRTQLGLGNVRGRSCLNDASAAAGMFAGPCIIAGTGSPETVITAPVGSLYMRSDGGAGTSLYVKETGAGNTGWVAK